MEANLGIHLRCILYIISDDDPLKSVDRLELLDQRGEASEEIDYHSYGLATTVSLSSIQEKILILFAKPMIFTLNFRTLLVIMLA